MKIADRLNVRKILPLWVLGQILIGILNMTKGNFDVVQIWGEYLWLVSYKFGFIKRGLLGTLFQSVFGGIPLPTQLGLIVWFHKITAFFFFLAISAFFITISWKILPNSRQRYFFLFLFLALMITPLWPTLLYNVGYLDLVLMVVASLGFAVFFFKDSSQYLLILLGIIGPLFHEGFLFFWLPLVIIIWHENLLLAKKWRWPSILLVTLAPFAVVYLASIAHNNQALIQLFDEIMLPAEIEKALIEVQFNQTPTYIMPYMLFLFQEYTGNFWVNALYFLIQPILVTGLLLVSATDQKKPLKNLDYFLFLLVPFAPLSILLIAWDLSRFLSFSAFSTLLLLAYVLKQVRDGHLEIQSGSKSYQFALGALVGGNILFVPAPLIYSYFDFATPICNDVCPAWFEITPAAQIVSLILTYMGS
ncbi:MAG: hypothetical protein QNJ45_28220 [Ardenticatenaceae bacterium]|nr:hypothetical protein [Ardenticatenaceae bacterium]